PADIANSSSMGAAPATLAIALVTAAVGSMALTIAVSTRRRRRDLALLKTIGFTRRQISGALAWQATLTMAVAVVVGTVCGVVVGRVVWRAFAHQLHVVPDPVAPTAALVGIA